MITCLGPPFYADRKNEVAKTSQKKSRRLRILESIQRVTPGNDNHFHCPQTNCSLSFNHKSTLMQHYKAFHVHRQFRCLTCHKKFKHIVTFNTHKVKCRLSKSKQKRAQIESILESVKKEDLFWCPHNNCSRSYDHVQDLLHHYQVDHVGGEETASRSKELQKKEGGQHTRKSRGTETCSSETTSVTTSDKKGQDLSSKALTVCRGNDEKYHCPYTMCPKSYFTIDALRNHYRGEHLGKRYTCSKCNIQFKLQSTLCDHKRKRKCIGPNKSENSNHSNPTTRKEHLRSPYVEDTIQSSTDEHRCSKCTKKFGTIECLRLHEPKCWGVSDVKIKVQKSVSNGKINIIRKVTQAKYRRYHCLHKRCDASFRLKQNLENHYKTDHSRRHYVCTKCKFRFTLYHNLRAHQPICKGKKSAAELRVEKGMKAAFQKVEVGKDGWFDCPHENCPSRFSCKRSIYGHYRREHFGVKYHCANCHGKFKHLTSLQQHRKTCIFKKSAHLLIPRAKSNVTYSNTTVDPMKSDLENGTETIRQSAPGSYQRFHYRPRSREIIRLAASVRPSVRLSVRLSVCPGSPVRTV